MLCAVRRIIELYPCDVVRPYNGKVWIRAKRPIMPELIPVSVA